jgi:hypothetical protein
VSNVLGGANNLVIFGDKPIVQYFGADFLPSWGFVGVEACFLVAFTVAGWLSLTYVTHVKR